MTNIVELQGEAREVALAETQAVQALAHTDAKRQQLAVLVTAVQDGVVSDELATLLESVLDLGLQTGRIRAYYGPGGEQAAIRTLRGLPAGRLRTDSSRQVSSALDSLAGSQLRAITIRAIAPGAYTLTIATDKAEASVRLDRNGARITGVVA